MDLGKVRKHLEQWWTFLALALCFPCAISHSLLHPYEGGPVIFLLTVEEELISEGTGTMLEITQLVSGSPGAPSGSHQFRRTLAHPLYCVAPAQFSGRSW